MISFLTGRYGLLSCFFKFFSAAGQPDKDSGNLRQKSLYFEDSEMIL